MSYCSKALEGLGSDEHIPHIKEGSKGFDEKMWFNVRVYEQSHVYCTLLPFVAFLIIPC